MRAGVAAAALLVAGGAGAADLPMRKPAAAPAYDWSGFYVGGHAGFATAGSDFTATQPGGAANLTGTLDLFRRFDLFTGEGSNFGGFQAGYNTVFKSGLMVGVEADISFPGNMSGASTLATPTIGTATYSDLVEMSGSVRSPHRLCVRPLALLRDRRLCLDRGSPDPHPAQRQPRRSERRNRRNQVAETERLDRGGGGRGAAGAALDRAARIPLFRFRHRQRDVSSGRTALRTPTFPCKRFASG